jgi:oligopeptide/dipeptide ABC transporter ATP-binding protein
VSSATANGKGEAGNGVVPGTMPLVEARDIVKHFPLGRGVISRLQRRPGEVLKAVDGVSLAIAPGETIGLVGESGCGKTTFGRCLVRLYEPTSGEIRFRGEDILAHDAATTRRLRRSIQMIFQDPYSSLNPRKKVKDALGEVLAVHRICPENEIPMRVSELLERVGLSPAMGDRYPRQFSGGQRQRIGIARSLAVEPEFIVADEAVSALDVSIRAQIIDLLIRLQQDMGLAMVFISHDLAVVREISHRVLVLYLGRVMELADRDRIWQAPQHPYTKALLSAAPIPDPAVERTRQRLKLAGEPPSPMDPAAAFRFAPSRLAVDPTAPMPAALALKEVAPGHLVSEFDPD